MWHTIVTAFLIAGWLVWAASAKAAGGPLTDVYVECSVSENDTVGGNFCYAVKEKVRGSAAFRLAEDQPEIGVGVHVITLDPDSHSESAGNRSSVAVVLTTYTSVGTGPGSLEYYETAAVIDVGEDRVQSMATSVLSDIDRLESEKHRLFSFERAVRRKSQR
jgi:hypothetical protein